MKIGFLDTWYGILAPEQENMKRYANYLKEHGHSFEFLTPDGYLQRNTKVHANDENFDLILCTDASVEGMEILPDVPTFFVNWCPCGYLTISHFKKYVTNISVFDLMLPSCRTQEYDFLSENLTYGTPVADQKLSVYPSLSVDQMLSPNQAPSFKLFYAGINKDKGNKKGRYYELFSLLDKTGKLELYGPNNKEGESCWKDFISSKGEIPFDGKSILKKINDAGICLALNSPIHNNAGFITNRIFEACVAGAAIITDDNEFTRRYFNDNVFYVDIKEPEPELFKDICGILNYIETNQTIVIEKIKKCQKIFKENFSIEKSFENLCKIYSSYFEYARIQSETKKSITIICLLNNKADIDSIEQQIKKQCFKNFLLLFVVQQTNSEEVISEINARFPVKKDFIITNGERYGEILWKNKDKIDSDYFCFLDANSIWQFRFFQKNIERLSIEQSLFSYTGSFQYNSNKYQLKNNENFDICDFLEKIMSSDEDIVIDTSIKYETSFPLNCFLFSSELLKYADKRINIFNKDIHFYFLILSYFIKNDTGVFVNSVSSGIKTPQLSYENYNNFRRCDGLMIKNIFLAFHKYFNSIKPKNIENDISAKQKDIADENDIIRCLNKKYICRNLKCSIAFNKMMYFLIGGKKRKRNIEKKQNFYKKLTTES